VNESRQRQTIGRQALGVARVLAVVAVMAASLLWLTPVAAHELVPGQTGDVRFDQHLGQVVPADLAFRDESGQPVTLGQYFGERPIVLTMNYLGCPNLCQLMLENLGNSLNGLPFTLGDEYSVVTVSIDPRDTPALGRNARDHALQGYAHPEAAHGWHILTGTHAEIDRLADAVGFRYGYDPDQDEYAHPAGVIVLTPTGQVSRYIYGLDFPATDLRLALVEAGQQHIGSLADQILLTCYHYDAETGRYTPAVLSLLQKAGLVTVLGLGGFLGYLWRADLKRQSSQAGRE
jgi:protein SCO1/2